VIVPVVAGRNDVMVMVVSIGALARATRAGDHGAGIERLADQGKASGDPPVTTFLLARMIRSRRANRGSRVTYRLPRLVAIF